MQTLIAIYLGWKLERSLPKGISSSSLDLPDLWVYLKSIKMKQRHWWITNLHIHAYQRRGWSVSVCGRWPLWTSTALLTQGCPGGCTGAWASPGPPCQPPSSGCCGTCTCSHPPPRRRSAGCTWPPASCPYTWLWAAGTCACVGRRGESAERHHSRNTRPVYLPPGLSDDHLCAVAVELSPEVSSFQIHSGLLLRCVGAVADFCRPTACHSPPRLGMGWPPGQTGS